MQKPKPKRSKLLMCHYYSYSVISEYVLSIEIPKHQSTDMRGTIKFAQNILPSVEKIFVFSDDDLDDMLYSLVGGEWEAFEFIRSTTAA